VSSDSSDFGLFDIVFLMDTEFTNDLLRPAGLLFPFVSLTAHFAIGLLEFPLSGTALTPNAYTFARWLLAKGSRCVLLQLAGRGCLLVASAVAAFYPWLVWVGDRGGLTIDCSALCHTAPSSTQHGGRLRVR